MVASVWLLFLLDSLLCRHGAGFGSSALWGFKLPRLQVVSQSGLSTVHPTPQNLKPGHAPWASLCVPCPALGPACFHHP